MREFARVLTPGIRDWPLVLLCFFASAMVAFATMYNAEILRKLLDEVLVAPPGAVGGEFLRDRSDNLYLIIALAVGVTVMKGLGTFTQTYGMSHVCQKLVLNLKIKFYAHLQRLPLSFYAKNRTGDLVSRLNGDMLIIEQGLQTLIRVMADPLIILVLVGYMFYRDWRLALGIFLILPVIGILVRWLSARLRRAGRLLQNKVGDVSALIQESVTGIKIIKAFRMEEEKLKFFAEECKASFRFSMKSVKYNAMNSPVVEFADALGIALMIYLGSHAVIQGRLTPGELIGFLTSLGLLFHPLKKLTNGNALIQQSTGAVNRVFEVLGETEESFDAGRDLPENTRACLELKNVSFSFEGDRAVLKDVSLKVDEGDLVALVGPSGGGKTTLVSLLPRFYECSEGAILLDGMDISQLNLGKYRQLFGIVPQEVVLFQGSIEDNIRFAKPKASLEEIQAACVSANAHDFIMSLEKGYSTHLSEMGVGLSGGQRQRLAIARALLKDPRILILDEATSALDSESEKLVQDALERVMKGRTTFVIAHRISTIVNAGCIVVLNQGRIEAQGSHLELLKNSSIYPGLCKSSGSGGMA